MLNGIAMIEFRRTTAIRSPDELSGPNKGAGKWRRYRDNAWVRDNWNVVCGHSLERASSGTRHFLESG
jgi:hypothetical protein